MEPLEPPLDPPLQLVPSSGAIFLTVTSQGRQNT